jgi:hypothetical protein
MEAAIKDRVEDTDSRLSFVAFDKATTPPKGLIRHIKDHWWVVHPTKGVTFWRKHSPQCNSNEEIAKRLAMMYPWAEVRFMPSVFHTINPNDYC